MTTTSGGGIRQVRDTVPTQQMPTVNYDDLTFAWSNHAQARNALHRAEARLEAAQTYSPQNSQAPKSILTRSYKYPLDSMDDRGQVRVPIDRVPSMQIGSRQHNPITHGKHSHSRHMHNKEKIRKRVTIPDNFTARDSSLHPVNSSQRSDWKNHRLSAPPASSKQIDNAQIHRLEEQLKSLSQTLKSSPLERSPLRYNDDDQQRNNNACTSYDSCDGRLDYPRRATNMAHSPSSHEILSRGSANLSAADSSTAVRVLNDLTSSSQQRSDHRYKNDYVPAYERLYGTQPRERLSVIVDDQSKDLSDTVLQRLRSGRKVSPLESSTSDHMERLRQKVQEQKATAAVAIANHGPHVDRVRHWDDDPVIVQNSDNSGTNEYSRLVESRNPVRKIATAPAAPAYRGFSEVETRIQMQDGKISTEDNLTRKISRKNQSQWKSQSADTEGRTLQPSMALQHQNKPRTKTGKMVRKVHKAPSKVASSTQNVSKPKRPKHKDVISATSWREGQKTVLKILGPAPHLEKQEPQPTSPLSPPTHDMEEALQPSSSHTVTLATLNDQPEDNLVTEPTQEGNEVQPDLGRLSPNVKNVLDDLHLDDSDEESLEECREQPKSDNKKPGPCKATQNGAIRKWEPEVIVPTQKIRHYDSNNVRKYMAKQKAERRHKFLEEKNERRLAQERTRDQLRELSKKQKQSIRLSQRNRDNNNRGELGETFSKGLPPLLPPPLSSSGQVNRVNQLPRHHPFRQDQKKMDITSSDKENKNIWSTSSSDSSIQSSLPSDIQPNSSNIEPSSPSNAQTSTPSDDPSNNHDDASQQPPRQPSPIGVIVTQMVASGADVKGPGQESKVNSGLEATKPARTAQATRSKADRIQALKATAAALQGKIDSEVRKLTQGDMASAVPSPGDNEMWAYPFPSPSSRDVHLGQTSGVESPADNYPTIGAASQYQRMIGSDLDHRVFTGSLPGTSNVITHAKIAADLSDQNHAATKIQAAFRGHTVRQRLYWDMSSGRSPLRGAVGRRTDRDFTSEALPYHYPDGPTSPLYDGPTSPLYNRPITTANDYDDDDDASLSEGFLPDSSAAEDPDYMPTFKSLPAAHSHTYHPPTSPPPGGLAGGPPPLGGLAGGPAPPGAAGGPPPPPPPGLDHLYGAPGMGPPPPSVNLYGLVSDPEAATNHWKESLADGLSVINIFTRKNHNANRVVLYGQLPNTAIQPSSDSPIGYSYNNDFTGSDVTSPRSSKMDDFTKSKTKSPATSSKSSRRKASTDQKSSERSRVTEQRSVNVKVGNSTMNLSPNVSFASSSDESHCRRKSTSRTPSPKVSSASKIYKDHSSSLASPSGSSLGSKIVPSSPDSTLSSGSLSWSPVADQQTRDKSKKFRSKSHSMSDRSKSSSLSTSSGRSKSSGRSNPSTSSSSSRSPLANDTLLDNFRPIQNGLTTSDLNSGAKRPAVIRASTAAVAKPPVQPSTGPAAKYSPAALSLKMASELNLLESLEASVRQLSDMERARCVSLAQQESVSLARVLQARQQDHEREIQLLSLKARQEVEEANKQLEVVRQRAVETASDAEKVLAQARREASEAVSDGSRRLLESQAESARITAQAAKQFAEAQRNPPQPTQLTFDPSKLASETATAATTAAVTAALEQQRLQHLDFLQEMKGSFGRPIQSRNVGDYTAPSSHSLSRTSITGSINTYSDDFTDATKPPSSSQHTTPSAIGSPSSHQSARAVRSSDSIPTASNLAGSLSSHQSARAVRSSDSIPTASNLAGSLSSHQSARAVRSSDSIPTASNLAGSPSSNDTSIRTESCLSPIHSPANNSSIGTASDIAARLSTVHGCSSISEDVDNSPSTRSSLTPSSTSTPIRQKPAPIREKPAPIREKPKAIREEPPPIKEKPAPIKEKPTHISDNPAPIRDKLAPEAPTLPPPAADTDFTAVSHSFTQLTAEMLLQQLRDEELRAQQQGALFKLQEKTLLEKAKADLEWLEHEKRQHQDKGELDDLQNIRRQQQILVAKVQQEQAEIRRLRSAQKAASEDRRLCLLQQQDIIRMRKATENVKNNMKHLPDVSVASSIGGALDNNMASPEISNGLPLLTDSLSPDSVECAESSDERDGVVKSPLTPVEKQAQVMQKLKRLQQPLSMKYLTKREQQLAIRRRNAEELLAWQKRLDEEESQIVNMERQALIGRQQDKQQHPPNKTQLPHPPMKALPLTPRPSLPNRAVSNQRAILDGSTNDKRDIVRSEENGSMREESSFVVEDISQSIPEYIRSEDSPNSISTPHAPNTSPCDDTLKHSESIPDEYTNDSYNNIDRTLTKTSPTLTPSFTSEYYRAPLSPHRRLESESGSESEKSFSQTVSEIASDQSDIEGRVKALEVELRKRKIEAEKLRRQQKRMQREKLKAQEASLKKQLESYDKLIEKTKAELKTESEAAANKMTSSSVKPQIKQLRVSESQRLKDRSHTRSLRQRAVSESSREGGIVEPTSSQLGSIIKQRSASEGSVSMSSSRSSLDDGEGAKEQSYTSFSSVFTPPSTSHPLEDIVQQSPRSPTLPSANRSNSATSISEDISDKTTSSYSDEDSQKMLTIKKAPSPIQTENHSSVKKQGFQKISEDVVADPSVMSKVFENIQSADNSLSGTSDLSLRESPKSDGEGPRRKSLNDPNSPGQILLEDQASEKQDHSVDENNIPDEAMSFASSLSQDSVKSTPRLLDLNESRHSPRTAEDEPLRPPPRRVAMHASEELSERSDKSCSSSVQSTVSYKSRTQSEPSGVAYSDEFFESSVSLKIKEELSDTEDDISERLSIASEATEPSLESSRKLAFADRMDKLVHDTERVENRDATSQDVIGADDDRNPPFISRKADQLELSQDFTSYDIGDRVLVNGCNRGTLLFKGETHFAPGLWGGVGLDEPQGTNDGSLDGHVYFNCRSSHGMFISADRLEHLLSNYKSERKEPPPPQQPQFTLSSLSSKTASESFKPLAQMLRSEATEDDSFENDSFVEDFSEEAMTDDATLERLINSAAAAVESFHEEEDINKLFPSGSKEEEEEEAQTPSGPPPQEDVAFFPVSSKERLVDSITDHLTTSVVKESVKFITEVAVKQTHDDKIIGPLETHDRSNSLLEILVQDELIQKSNDKVKDEKEKLKLDIKKRIDVTTHSLLADAVTEMISLRNRQAAKELNRDGDTCSGQSQKHQKSPSPEAPSPLIRNLTPCTPDSESPTVPEETALDDDIFINRVKVETNHLLDLKEQDQVPVARPGSPVFGEPSGINPEALSERLEQMQQIGADIFEGDIFGEQEWFDDDFGSMPKSKSIIQVPVRAQESPNHIHTPIPGTPDINCLDLMRITTERFYVVPHNRKEVKSLVEKSVQVFHKKSEQGEIMVGSILPDSDIIGSDSQVSDIESTSRKSYKRLVFNLSGEAFQDITSEQELAEPPPWMKPKRRPRKYFFDKPPRALSDIAQVVEDRVLFVAGLTGKPRVDPSVNRFVKKKKDHVDEILTLELREEEQEWVNYDDDELAVKMQLTEAIFDSLLTDTAMVLNRIQDRRKARWRTDSEPEIEF